MLEIRVGGAVSGEVHITLRGQLTHLTSGQLRAALTAVLNRGQAGTVCLDLRAVDGVDSTGMATLAVARRICQAMGVRLRLAAMSGVAARHLGLLPGEPPRSQGSVIAQRVPVEEVVTA